jgi:hypothetical protein
MKTINVEDIAKDLEAAANYYINDVCKDRVGGTVRAWFDAALQARGLADVVEIAEPTSLFVDASTGDTGTLITTIGGNAKYVLTRTVTPRIVTDISLIRTYAQRFMLDIQDAVKKYVKNMPADTAIASVPVLYIDVCAYQVSWMLWGYVGVALRDSVEILSNKTKDNR